MRAATAAVCAASGLQHPASLRMLVNIRSTWHLVLSYCWKSWFSALLPPPVQVLEELRYAMEELSEEVHG
jgi:hypothetical protein